MQSRTMVEPTSKATVMAFAELAFAQRNPREAAEHYMREDYVQHNPQLPTGREAFVQFVAGLLEQAPETTYEIKRVIAEGEYVVFHAHLKMRPDDPGRAVADIFRVQDGRIAEHWDVIQPVPEASVNGNTMF
ncbi:MAG TPA: nuclear transport factor 2 family protein [Solirubrobacteraceae bacterium]|nr:nuclear transport factor 2 family protein [Solirubrobacteraceae bacterium]